MSNFLSAAWGADTPTAPIWLMRQAGRYLPEYRELKERYGFWRMCRTPEIAAEVTLQPVRRFPLDAAILFNDIMTPLPPMGVDIDFDPGPVIREPVHTPEAVHRLLDHCLQTPHLGVCRDLSQLRQKVARLLDLQFRLLDRHVVVAGELQNCVLRLIAGRQMRRIECLPVQPQRRKHRLHALDPMIAAVVARRQRLDPRIKRCRQHVLQLPALVQHLHAAPLKIQTDPGEGIGTDADCRVRRNDLLYFSQDRFDFARLPDHLARQGIEGSEDGRWTLIDYGDFVVHVFSPEDRAYYALEDIWGDAPRLDWQEPAAGEREPEPTQRRDESQG